MGLIGAWCAAHSLGVRRSSTSGWPGRLAVLCPTSPSNVLLHRCASPARTLPKGISSETVHEVNLVGGGDEPCGSDKAASADSAPAVGRVRTGWKWPGGVQVFAWPGSEQSLR